jgi:hypothetical protein
MPQTRMFRDRMVSMEQTLEGGEKHLELLKALCRDSMPEFEYTGHQLDHERDLFVMELAAPDGRRKKVAWTRMVLFDAERIPTITVDPASTLREKLVAFLKARAARPEIVVTFRHLEDGWVDTPAPRPSRRRGRRGGRGGRGAPGGRPAERPSSREAPRPSSGPGREAAPRPPGAGGPGAPSPGGGRPGRRRRRRRRRGGGGPGGGPAGPPSVKPS